MTWLLVSMPKQSQFRVLTHLYPKASLPLFDRVLEFLGLRVHILLVFCSLSKRMESLNAIGLDRSLRNLQLNQITTWA